MNSLTLAAAACAALYLGYLIYGRFMSRLWSVNPDRATPAVTRRDGVDYVPARNWTVLFGHHFASISGAGPIVGPVLACAVWGWFPSLLWLVFGAIFLGAVHDFSALMASLRADGHSVAEIAEAHLGHRVRLAFGSFVWVALVLVVAVFMAVAAQTLVMKPQMVIPALGLIPVAILAGFMLYRWQVPTWLATCAGLGALAALMVIGYYVPVALPWGPKVNQTVWMLVLAGYCYFASIAPVTLILQPRDYLSAFLLVFGVAAGYLGLALTHPSLHAPAFQGFANPQQGDLWPMLFVVIACGAISGFHSLVAGGTTSKQIANERHATRIGFGGMIAESAVSVLAVLAVAAGLTWGRGAGSYDVVLSAKGPLVAFADGYASLTSPFFGAVGGLIALIILNAFVLTTLDSATRITRYISEELFGRGLGIVPFRNRWFATAVVVALAAWVAFLPWKTVWPLFGSSNQLIAGLTLLVVTVVLSRLGKPTLYTFLPALFMLVTTVAALVTQSFSLWRKGHYALVGIAVLLVILALTMVADSLMAMRRGPSGTAPA